MAKHGEDPILSSPSVATERLNQDLPIVLKGRTLEAAGWQHPDQLTLFIPLWGNPDSTSPDLYLVRFQFGYYPEWPPSAQFVNPVTLKYEIGKDAIWLPRIEGNPRIQVHADYANTMRQVVCSSMTLEFYQVHHGGKEEEIWTTDHNFAATLNEINMGLRPSGGYKGRQA